MEDTRMHRRFHVVAGCLLATTLATGCFTREESIEIRPDGSATVTYEVEGTWKEMGSKTGLPGDAGWALVSKDETDASGKDEVTYTWQTHLRDLNDYPNLFARPGDPHAAAYLQTRTRLEIEEQEERTIYRFSRRYLGRRAGKFEELQDSSDTEKLLEKADEQGFEALTPHERESLFAGLAEYEAAAIWLRMRDALGQAVLEEVLPVSSHETVTKEVEEYLESRLTGDYLQRFFATSEAEQEEELRLFQRELRAEVRDMLPAAGLERILFLLEHEDRKFAVTEDLSDDLFALEVKLPGTVVVSNAVLVEGGEVAWQFDGVDLTEGDLVLHAVSVVEHGRGSGR
jgi:hypothetical protein